MLRLGMVMSAIRKTGTAEEVSKTPVDKGAYRSPEPNPSCSNIRLSQDAELHFL
jgi:hypothetical protein